MNYPNPTITNSYTLRPDLQAIADLIEPASPLPKVLDLGCGDGTLLAHLNQRKQIVGRGIEISEDGVLACIRLGLSVRQGNLEEGLADYPDDMFEYVILSQTLAYLNDPERIISEMLRVGNQAIISFTNWGYWRCRVEWLLKGKFPQSPDLPAVWHDKRRWQTFTIADFVQFCRDHDIKISREIYLAGDKVIGSAENLLATTAVFSLTKA